MVWQGLDYVGFLLEFADRIYHVDCKDTKMRVGNGRNGILSSHLPWADPRRGWDFISTGHGDTRWEDIFRMLNQIQGGIPHAIQNSPRGRRCRRCSGCAGPSVATTGTPHHGAPHPRGQKVSATFYIVRHGQTVFNLTTGTSAGPSPRSTRPIP